MREKEFDKLAKQETERMLDVMCSKSADYADDKDKLFNFKQAGRMDNISPIEALRGMWLKHRASMQQGLDELLENSSKTRSRDWWIEKLTDDRNYNLLLFALLEEQYFIPDGTSPGYGSKEDDLIDEIFGRPFYNVTPKGTLMMYCGCGGVKPVEDNEPEEFEGFTIELSYGNGWFIDHFDRSYLWKDLELHKSSTGYVKFTREHDREPEFGEAPGYYKTKDEARDTIRAYKNKPVWEIMFHCGTDSFTGTPTGGWYIWNCSLQLHLEKDFTLHVSTGEQAGQKFGTAPGYYPTKEIAEAYLKAYKEKHSA